jgi:hypothetical protein
MNEIGLDWNSQNTTMKINVNFAYREWTVDNVNTAFGSALDSILGLFGASLGDFTNNTSYGSFNTGPSLFSASFNSQSSQTSGDTTSADTTSGSPSNI